MNFNPMRKTDDNPINVSMANNYIIKFSNFLKLKKFNLNYINSATGNLYFLYLTFHVFKFI